ncbi:hypothetical protein ONZ45_g11615 [Pleurotus djamor]|nr:hypothetical protein ONZ45_g11615 [Pleurotus djamor]
MLLKDEAKPFCCQRVLRGRSFCRFRPTQTYKFTRVASPFNQVPSAVLTHPDTPEYQQPQSHLQASAPPALPLLEPRIHAALGGTAEIEDNMCSSPIKIANISLGSLAPLGTSTTQSNIANKAIIEIIRPLGKTRSATKRAYAAKPTPSGPTNNTNANPQPTSTVQANSTKPERVPVVDPGVRVEQDITTPSASVVDHPAEKSTTQTEDGEKDTALTLTDGANAKQDVVDSDHL